MERFKHLRDPEHPFLDHANDRIDKPANATGGGKQRAPVRVLSRLFRPVVLGHAQLGAMVVYRHGYRQPVVGLTGKMMLILGSLSTRQALALKTNDWICTS